jgi:hypothetical protein
MSKRKNHAPSFKARVDLLRYFRISQNLEYWLREVNHERKQIQ